MEEKRCGGIIVAAGSARRMQGIDKMLEPLMGIPVLLHTVRALAASPRIGSIYIVTREDLIPVVESLCRGEEKLRKVLPGGESRGESVLCGLAAAREELVAIHDGARPLVTAQIIDETIAAAERWGAAAPAIPVHDTVKIAKNGIVTETPDRSTLFAVQTPQVFRRCEIEEAIRHGLQEGLPLTDDCSAAEYAGQTVRLTNGSVENIKITVPTDLLLAEAILKERVP